MGGLNHKHTLAGTALALILALPSGVLAETPAALDAAVPMPQSATLPAPTAKDATATPAAATPATTATVPSAAPTVATDPAAAPTTTAVAAPAEAPPPDPLAALDPADRPIAEKMRDLLAAKSDKVFDSKKEHAAVETFYQNRTLAPLWLDKGVMNARAKAVIARLKASDADGLDPKDYKIPDLSGTSPDALAEAELKMTATVLTFTRHLQAGRFPFARISTANIEVPQEPPDPATVLTKIADSKNLAKTIDEYQPPHKQYLALKAMLAELRGKTGEEQADARIPDGPTLKPGMEDSRVPALRKRLKVAGDETSLRYDDDLVKAVKAFQKHADLNADGLVGPGTLRHINGGAPPKRADAIEKIIVNMERWRWYPRDMGKAYVLVNIPEYKLRVYKDSGATLAWETRIVTGQPSKQTPLLVANMKYITVNPTWNVPPSIINNEYLPALQQDPTVLDRMGLKVTHNRDGSIHIYQPPGDGNALGRVRFNFPNKFLVYQHDTPDKYLFAKDERAYSHGCMRVQDPPKYAEVLLGIARPGEKWTAERIHSMYGHAEQDIQFQTQIPVNITYQTASVEDGKLVIRKDIYGYDSRMLSAIKNDRGVVMAAADRPHERESSGSGSSSRRVRQAVQQPRQMGFFEALFGGGFQQQQQPVRPQRRIR